MTMELIKQRFWWPELEQDVAWYMKTCEICQKRQMLKVRIPPMVTHTPSIFQVIHMDTMHMPVSSGYHYIVHGRCALTSWMEGKMLKTETGKAIGYWLFCEVFC